MTDLDKQVQHDAALKAYDEQRSTRAVAGQAVQGYSPAPMKQNMCGEGPYRVPLREQLEKVSYGDTERFKRCARAFDILARHPEFEEFFELQELINRGLFR